MKKQAIIVTGASSGIGKEVARHFLEKGDNVVINSTTVHNSVLQQGIIFN